jgi:CHAT domain-containing protein
MMEDLDEAITYHRAALTLRPPGHPDCSTSLNNLANAVLTRYHRSGRTKDLNEGVTYQRQALSLCPPSHLLRSMFLNNLANAIHTQYKQSGRMEDLEEGITYHREALTLRPLGRPERSQSLNNLAIAVYARYEKSSMVEDIEESFLLMEQAVNDMAASSKYRLTVAIRWIGLARQHHDNSVIRAFSMSLHLLECRLIFYPDVDSQQKFLATIHIPKSLASDAASAAIDAGDLVTAVELLEQGRAIIWSKMKGYRHPLDPLRQVNRQLADALENINAQLEQLALSSESGLLYNGSDHHKPNLEVQIQRNRILSAEWEKVIGQIREIDGFHNFLQAVPFSTLQTAAAEGPVILINISNFRSDAIIILIDKPPSLVTLPNVRPKHLIYLGQQLDLARQPDTHQRSTLILPILRDLWNDIVSPVCNCLSQLGIPQESRIWWCPTSKLCALPLHAAGLYESKKQNFNLPDIYTSSYTPTLSALISARSNTVIGQSIVPKLLVIGQPDTESLANVKDEINDIQQFGDFVDVMVGEDASPEAVIHGLQQHSWAHFACHGHLEREGDYFQPFHASFKLHDENHLTLLDLIQARLPNAEFAFLASCHSAAGDSRTPDEAIHLAAAMQFCGFRSVVGTLWELADRAGPIVSKAFYNYIITKKDERIYKNTY